MTISAELVLSVVGFVLLVMSIKEYLTNGRVITPKLKTWGRVIAIFILVIMALQITK